MIDFNLVNILFLAVSGSIVLIIGILAYGFIVLEPKIANSYENIYDVKDVQVFLDSIDSNWHDFQDSKTLRKTYEDCRDGKVSLADIKKKKNTTTDVPLVIHTR